MRAVVIGAQWGDEGKGKIVDFLAKGASLIVRFSGGANAGHTIVVGDKTYKLHLIPSGIMYSNKRVILGTGMVIDFESMFKELEGLTSQGVNWEGRVHISDRAHIVLPRFKDMDIEQDKKRRRPIGTTGRGIGVAYSQKAMRDGMRVGDMYDPEAWDSLSDEDRKYLEPYRDKVKDMVVDMASFMHKHRLENTLFEGAQGTLLDIDNGTYPFVSSGTSSAYGASAGTGVGPKDIGMILGVFKAYSTRVGNGPFPTEFDPAKDKELETFVRDTGREYGVTTGRPRRIGYLDLVALRYACITNSIDYLALTHLDVYDTMDSVQLCVAYDIDGEEVRDFPSSISKLNRAKPVLKTFKGWNTTLTSSRAYDDLPVQAQEYVSFIEEYTGVRVSIVSVGYRREETIVRNSVWKE